MFMLLSQGINFIKSLKSNHQIKMQQNYSTFALLNAYIKRKLNLNQLCCLNIGLNNPTRQYFRSLLYLKTSGKILFLQYQMKAIKQRFHRQIVRKFKENYFATARKQLLELQEFHTLYNRILDNNQDLITLVETMGYVVFFKHINQILEEKLYQKLYYQDQKYFLQNLNFVSFMLNSQLLPQQQTSLLICGLAQILKKQQNRISIQNICEIFEIIQTILQTEKYFSNSLEVITKESLIPKLYEIIIIKELNQYFFKIIGFCKIINNEKVSKINDEQKLHCLQIHILTSNNVEELYISYSLLGDIFQKKYSHEEQLFEYGSILDKTIKDIAIDRLIDPISYFFMKALSNRSLCKLIVEMNYIEVIYEVILNNLMEKNNVSIFGHQSIWFIFRKILSILIKTNKFYQKNGFDWTLLKQRLQNYHAIKYPYVKMEVYQTLTELSSTNLEGIFADLLHFYFKDIQQQLQEVKI